MVSNTITWDKKGRKVQVARCNQITTVLTPKPNQDTASTDHIYVSIVSGQLGTTYWHLCHPSAEPQLPHLAGIRVHVSTSSCSISFSTTLALAKIKVEMLILKYSLLSFGTLLALLVCLDFKKPQFYKDHYNYKWLGSPFVSLLTRFLKMKRKKHPNTS